MKIKTGKKLCAVLLTFVMLAAGSLSAFAEVGLGTVIYDESTYIAPNSVYKKQIAMQGSNRQVAFTMDIDTRDGRIVPYVYTGKVTSKYTLSNKIHTLNNQGEEVIAAINGDFYTVSTGVPLGLTIHDGKIKTSGVNYSNCLAFRYDGSAFMGSPNIEVTMQINDSEGKGIVSMINKVQGTTSSVNFYNSEFGATTQTTKDCVEVIVSAPEGAEPTIGGTIVGTVKAVRTKTKSTPLYTNEFVLSTDAKVPNANYLSKIKEGDKITINVTDKTGAGWENVKECIGAYQAIVKNGTVTTTDKTVNPRTCVGIKADGTLLLYVVDGRQSGYSAGMNLIDIANYMISKGCVWAANFDGGGSTTAAAKMPWENDAAIVNKPSGGSQRANSNSLLFLAGEQGSGVAENLHITSLKTNILTGATTKFTAAASDSMYNVVSTPYNFATFSVPGTTDSDDWQAGYSYGAPIGTIDRSGNFKAGDKAMTGYVMAEYGDIKTTADVRVFSVDEVNISVTGVGSHLDIKPGTRKDLSISVTDKNNIPVIAQNNVFTWVCDPEIGTVDSNGSFTSTSELGATGAIRIYYPDAKSTAENQPSTQEQEGADEDGIDAIGEEGQVAGDADTGDSTVGEAEDDVTVNYGRLIKEIQVTVGTLPVILEDFESGIAGWSTGGMNMGEKAVAIKHQTFAENPNTVFFGKGSLKIYYDMKTKGYKKGAAGAYAIKPLAISGYPSKIGMWVYGDGKGHWLRSEIKDSTGKTVFIDYTNDINGVDWTGWKYVEAAVPTGLKAPLTLSVPVRYMEKVEGDKGKGIIYIDNIRAVYDAVNDDKIAPTIEPPSILPGDVITSKSEFSVQIIDDDKGTGVNWDRVRIYLDGKEITKGVIKNADNDGVLRWNLADSEPVADGKHTIKILAKDHFQNLANVEWEYIFSK